MPYDQAIQQAIIQKEEDEHQVELIVDTKKYVNQDGKLMKDWQGLDYDGPYIGEGQAWGLTLRNHCNGEEQVDAWIRWINEAMKVYVRLRVNHLWIKKKIGDMDETWDLDHMMW